MSTSTAVVIDNPRLLGVLCGPNDRNLAEISTLFSSPVRTRGNEIFLESENEELCLFFNRLLRRLTDIAGKDQVVNSRHIQSVYTALESGREEDEQVFEESVIHIPGGLCKVYPRGLRQAEYVQCMSSSDLVFSIGPAGTGKTYLTVAHALMELLTRRKRKIVITRPVVESGENLGFLPGDLTQKLGPYLRPLYDAMEDLIEPDLLARLQASGQIEVAPLAYMRGRSLKNCYIVLDEAQNTTVEQMKMFLTRLGEGSRAVVTGDLTQVDLPRPEYNGLADACKVLSSIDDIAFVHFDSGDVVRHPLVRKIVDAYKSRA
ncbi:MAG: phosphate starvation-inducible protein PhoH [Spirochaetales bacterium]|nr:MAG: phosphate starvation-inducible protein PhoH [Spirochaetales bacterium]